MSVCHSASTSSNDALHFASRQRDALPFGSPASRTGITDQGVSMIRSRTRSSALLALFSPLLFQACADGLPSAPVAPVALRRSAPAGHRPPHLAICPITTTESITRSIGPEGGSLRIAGHRMVIPPGVVASPTEFTLRAPAGRYLTVDIMAGASDHLQFSSPLAVTISYARCKRQNLLRSSAEVWYIDTAMGAPIAYLGGRDHPERRNVTFFIDHLSGVPAASSNGLALPSSDDPPPAPISRGIYAVAY